MIEAGDHQSERATAAALAAAGLTLVVAVVAAGVVFDHSPMLLAAGAFAAAAGALACTSRTALSWRSLLSAVILVILFIPIRRYELPGSLPFQLEPYRVLIAFVGLGWISSLLIDPKVRFRSSPLHAPLFAVVLVSAASFAFNVERIQSLNVSQDATKQFTFLLSFMLVFCLIVSVVQTWDDIDTLLKVLVAGGTVVALLALFELNTGINVFNNLDRVFPFLQPAGGPSSNLVRYGRLRVYASAQHPIGLGELLVLLIPMAIYVAVITGRRRWFVAAIVLGIAAFGTVSRTAVVSLLAIGIVYLILRPAQTFRFWPLVLPGLIAVHIAMPGVLGSMYKGIFPQKGLIAQEAGGAVGSSRTASFGPGMHEVGLRPLLGGGYGSRIPTGPSANSFIVDDQWLSTAMETGIAGVAVWLWVFARFIRLMFRAARRDRTPRGWLFVGAAATATGFAVGMATYDSFSFIQATLVLFILLAIGCAGLTARADEEARRGPAAA